MHKRRGYIGEPRAFVFFLLRMFMWLTDLNEGMLNYQQKRYNHEVAGIDIQWRMIGSSPEHMRLAP